MSEYIFKANFKIDNCLTCPVSNIVMNCPCFTGEAHASEFCDSKHPNCPLKELPPHGRLIDADVLYNKIIQNIKDLDEDDEDYDVMRAIYQSMLFELDNEIPTILEASKED